MKANSPEYPRLHRSNFIACMLLCAGNVLRTICTCAHKLVFVGRCRKSELCEQLKNSKNFWTETKQKPCSWGIQKFDKRQENQYCDLEIITTPPKLKISCRNLEGEMVSKQDSGVYYIICFVNQILSFLCWNNSIHTLAGLADSVQCSSPKFASVSILQMSFSSVLIFPLCMAQK